MISRCLKSLIRLNLKGLLKKITQFGDFLDDSDTSSMSLVVLTGAAVKRVVPVTAEPGSLPVKVAV